MFKPLADEKVNLRKVKNEVYIKMAINSRKNEVMSEDLFLISVTKSKRVFYEHLEP